MDICTFTISFLPFFVSSERRHLSSNNKPCSAELPCQVDKLCLMNPFPVIMQRRDSDLRMR